MELVVEALVSFLDEAFLVLFRRRPIEGNLDWAISLLTLLFDADLVIWSSSKGAVACVTCASKCRII